MKSLAEQLEERGLHLPEYDAAFHVDFQPALYIQMVGRGLRKPDMMEGYLARQCKKRADVVRQALITISADLAIAGLFLDSNAAEALSTCVDDKIIARLGRLLR
jgi:hypothetical protein